MALCLLGEPCLGLKGAVLSDGGCAAIVGYAGRFSGLAWLGWSEMVVRGGCSTDSAGQDKMDGLLDGGCTGVVTTYFEAFARRIVVEWMWWKSGG